MFNCVRCRTTLEEKGGIGDELILCLDCAIEHYGESHQSNVVELMVMRRRHISSKLKTLEKELEGTAAIHPELVSLTTRLDELETLLSYHFRA